MLLPHQIYCRRRPTAPIAEKFSFLMRMVVPGVVSATGSVTFEQLLDISPEDCLFVINFNPYGEEVRRWIDLAHSRGAKIILLTDKPSTPFSDFTDVLLLADIYSVSFSTPMYPPLFFWSFLSLWSQTRWTRPPPSAWIF